MELSLELILEQIRIKLPTVYGSGHIDHKFRGLAMFSDRFPPTQALDVLYVGSLRDLRALPGEQVAGRTFCCVGTAEELDQVLAAHQCNLLHFEPPLDLATCYNELQFLFQSFDDLGDALDRVLMTKGTVQDMVDLMEPFLDNPLYVWDYAFKIQGMTRHIDTSDNPYLRYISERGQLPVDLLEKVSHASNGLMHNAELHSTLRIHYPPNITNVQFALRIFMSGQKSVLVLCCYFTESSATMGRVELIQLLVDKLERYVKEHYPKSQLKSAIYEPLIVDLVEGRLRHKEDILERLHLINLPYETPYRIYYIVPEKYSSSIIRYLLHASKRNLPYAKIIQYQNGVLILDQESKENRDSETVQAKVTNARVNIAKVMGHAGISSACVNLSEVRGAFLQAKASIELGRLLNPDEIVYFYRDYYIYHMLDACANHPHMELGRLYFRRLDLLEQSDLESKNDNMKLLEVYLRNSRNITSTAREMHLHRNSVIYRLDRIEDILRVPLGDPDVQLRLLVSFHVRRLIGALGKA